MMGAPLSPYRFTLSAEWMAKKPHNGNKYNTCKHNRKAPKESTMKGNDTPQLIFEKKNSLMYASFFFGYVHGLSLLLDVLLLWFILILIFHGDF